MLILWAHSFHTLAKFMFCVFVMNQTDGDIMAKDKNSLDASKLV